MHLDIVTPRGRLLSEEVDEVTAPGVLGEFGVLPGHIPFLTALKPGVLSFQKGGARTALAVGPGFVEVSTGDRVVVLCDQGAKIADIDVAAARKEQADLQHQLDHWTADDAGARADLEAKRAWAEARLAAAGESALTTTH
ncbi:MAG: F0F1 ATP synthase subunit epsilon [Myxococcales bacterium]|nr:F0F1 ATP synthase subunit epsilon [Myxococcales bacterium]